MDDYIDMYITRTYNALWFAHECARTGGTVKDWRWGTDGYAEVLNEGKDLTQNDCEARAKKELAEAYAEAFGCKRSHNNVIEIIQSVVKDKMKKAIIEPFVEVAEKDAIAKVHAIADKIYEYLDEAKVDGLNLYNERTRRKEEAKIQANAVMKKFENKKEMVVEVSESTDAASSTGGKLKLFGKNR